MLRLINLLYGYYRIRVSGKIADCINLLMLYNINYWGMVRDDKGILFSILRKDIKKLTKIMELHGIEFEFVKKRGIIFVVERYKKRAGVFVGAAIFLFLIYSSTFFIWDINVTGNETIGDTEIIEALEKEGCYIGAYTKKIDFYMLCHDFLLHNKNIAWISVNMKGTTAEVQVIEKKEKQMADGIDENGIANIIAERDGVIKRFQIYSGKAQVHVGDSVYKGQLLVSGVFEGRNYTHFGDALGKVFAETRREFSATVKYDTEKTVEKERVLQKNSLNILGKTINLLTKGRKIEGEYDTIKEKNRIILFGVIELPIWQTKEYSVVYEKQPVKLTEEEAKRRAEDSIVAQIEKEIPEGEILELEKIEKKSGSAYTLVYKVRCIEDIAVRQEIGTTD